MVDDDDKEHQIDDWLHHQQHIKVFHLNGFPIGNVWQNFEMLYHIVGCYHKH